MMGRFGGDIAADLGSVVLGRRVICCRCSLVGVLGFGALEDGSIVVLGGMRRSDKDLLAGRKGG